MYFLLKIGIFHCYVSLPEGHSKSNCRDKSKQLHAALEKSKLLTFLGGCETPPQNSHQQEKITCLVGGSQIVKEALKKNHHWSWRIPNSGVGGFEKLWSFRLSRLAIFCLLGKIVVTSTFLLVVFHIYSHRQNFRKQKKHVKCPGTHHPQMIRIFKKM